MKSALSFAASLAAGLIATLGLAAAEPAAAWWPAGAVEPALVRAGTNRQELVRVLEQAPVTQRDGALFLLTNMPPADLGTLSSAFLLGNLDLAYRAWAEAPWSRDVPSGHFFNDVLPYASVDEPREDWRAKVREIALPLVQGCTTPGEAARRLNERLFPLVKVKYSTQRRHPAQGPLETMESGKATCTGLSILLVDACRAVGVPARVVGTQWAHVRGNHTWVEIWDQGWHFAGAAEPDPNGLDRAWFTGNAAQTPRNDPVHAIYATSFQRTGVGFPLAWAEEESAVPALDVTARYAPNSQPADLTRMRLMVRVLDRPVGKRVKAKLTVTDTADASVKLEGVSRDDTADMNDDVVFNLTKGRTYVIEAAFNETIRREHYTSVTNAQDVYPIYLGGIPPLPTFRLPAYQPPPVRRPLRPADARALTDALGSFFAAPPAQQSNWTFAPRLERLLRANEPAVRQAAWQAYRSAPIHEALRADFEARRVRSGNVESPFTTKTVGTRPTNGWGLVIAMHGGGGAPKQVNDSQWVVMQRHYRDHPEQGGYHYVALRAPNDEWNGFYADYVYPLIATLIRQHLLFADVDPNRVVILGYSHGGYGAFAIGPKMPDRFAAIHASAAAPTDGEMTARTLRSTRFSCMVGEKDVAYGRIERDRRFADTVRELRGERDDIYPVGIQIIPDNGHTGLPDRDKLAELLPHRRNPVPRALSWEQTDGVIRDFFWVGTDTPAKGQSIEAACDGNRVTLTTKNVSQARVGLDARLVNFGKPVTLVVNGTTREVRVQPRLRTLCASLLERGDPELAFPATLTVP